jgi:cytohesin
MSRDSAPAKIAVVVGIGAVAIGLVALRDRLAPPSNAATADRVQVTATTAASASTGNSTTTGTPANAITPGAAGGEPEKAAAPRAPTQADRIALLEACTEGDQARVEALFAKGVNLDGTLGNAARSGNAALVGFLLAHGVDAKEDDDLSVPPLLMADEHDAVVDVLLARGAHEPTLAKAVAAAAPKAVSRLLAKGASATSKTADGEPVLMTALHDATGAKRRAIVDALLKAGADVNTRYDDDTPLSLALASATQHASGSEEQRPGDRAVDMLARLVAKGAKVDGDALVTALNSVEDQRASLLDTLLAGSLTRGATLQAVTHAAEAQDVASIKRLAAKGIAWSALEAHATPPLVSAITAADVPVVKALLEAGAPMDKLREEDDTALLAAVAGAAGGSDDAVRVVRVLLEHGANPNKRGRDGRTALFAAAEQGSEAVVTLLVAKGARVDDAVDGMTPLEIADTRGSDGVVKLLKARGAHVRASKSKKTPSDE